MDGFVFLWRKSIDSPVFQNPELWKVWCWCLLKANHKDRHVNLKIGKGSTIIKIQKGQFIFGRNKCSEELSMTPSSVRNRMRKLEEMGNISLNSNNQYSVVTICNWGDYQVDTHTMRTTKGQPKDTDNNVNNDKKRYGEFQNVLLTDAEYEKLKDRFNGSLSDKIEALSEYMRSKGRRYKDHYATILSWARKETKETGSVKNDRGQRLC